MKSFWIFPVCFLILGLFLDLLAFLLVISESGEAHASVLCNAVIYISFWPSFLIGIDKNDFFSSLLPSVANVLGWMALGLLIAFLRKGIIIFSKKLI
jgi:hypothetical protein